MATPTDVLIDYDDGSTDSLHQTPAIWMSDQKKAVVNITTKKNIQTLTLDGGIFMDADVSNNVWKNSEK